MQQNMKNDYNLKMLCNTNDKAEQIPTKTAIFCYSYNNELKLFLCYLL